MIKVIAMIIIFILIIIIMIQIPFFTDKKLKGEYITLKEVIPDAKIISETEGIIEYKGKKFILGLNDLRRKRDLIRSLCLDTLSGYKEIDLRFRRQIIVRKNDLE
ncbi:MAG: hypothetical protein N3A65_02350 [candidate division WOR-3 bacterium]|nr:hypothetical protein [candidate division WOR-3 bacterium]